MNLKERLKLEELESKQLNQAYWRHHRPKSKNNELQQENESDKEAADVQGKP